MQELDTAYMAAQTPMRLKTHNSEAKPTTDTRETETPSDYCTILTFGFRRVGGASTSLMDSRMM